MARLVDRQHGVIIARDPETDRLQEIGTTQCSHCGAHMPIPRFGNGDPDRASRKGRGYCTRCNGYICGKGCLECVPIEARLQNIEAGRPELTPPPALVVSGWED